MRIAASFSSRWVTSDHRDNSLTFLYLVSFFVVTATATAQDLVPFTKDSVWTLTNQYSSSPVQITVEDAQQYGPVQSATVRFNNPWGAYTLLLILNSTGIYFEGYMDQGVTYRLPEPVPYFRTDMAIDTPWQSPFGRTVLKSKTATVTTPAGTFTGVYQYTITGGDGSSYSWFLKPGTGFVQFGDNASAFLASNYLVKPKALTSSLTSSGECAVLGLASMPSQAGISKAMRDAALKEAMAVGSRLVNVNASWAELEPTAGKYNFTRIQDELSLAQTNSLPVMFTLKVTDSIASGLPLDLQSQDLASTVVLSRLDKLLAALKPILPSQVKWLNVGYETDVYLFYRPNEVNSFRTLFQRAQSKLTGSYSLGVVQSFDTFRTSDLMFKQLVGLGAHVAFNYYGTGQDFRQRSTSAPLADIPLMVRAAAGKAVVINEVNYSSAGLDGSREKQSEFLTNVLNAVAQQPLKVKAVNVWALRDLPLNMVTEIALSQGLSGSSSFATFLGSLGLQDVNGLQKPAWQVFATRSSQFKSGSVCTGQ